MARSRHAIEKDVRREYSRLARLRSTNRRGMGAGLWVFAGLLFARPSLINLPFFIAGALKIAYDLLLYRAFVRLQPPEEVE